MAKYGVHLVATHKPEIWGGDLVVTKTGARLTVSESEVIRPDLIATNGVLHVIN